MSHAKSISGITLAPLMLALAAPTPLAAQAASVYTHSACMVGRASTGVADPCADGSAVFYGPAGVALLPGALSAGIVPIYTKSHFTFDSTGARFGSKQGTTFVPHAWATARPVERVGLGLGFWAPYGLRTEWPLSFEGRYVGYKNKLTNIYVQPTVAYQVVPKRLALGAGLGIVHGSVEINRRIDLATTLVPGTDIPFSAIGIPLGTDFANLVLKAHAWRATFQVGVEALVTERLALGVRYMHLAHLDLGGGTATFTQLPTGILLPANNPFGVPPGTPLDAVLAPLFAPGAPLSSQRAGSDLTLPNQLVGGVRFRLTPALKLLFDYQWTGWHQFDKVPIDFQYAPADTIFFEFHNTSTVRLGGDYQLSPLWALRAGVWYANAAEPDVSVTPFLPGARRWAFTTGFGYRMAHRFHADAGVEFLTQPDRRGSVRPRTSESQTAAELNVGTFDAFAWTFGLTLSYRWGEAR